MLRCCPLVWITPNVDCSGEARGYSRRLLNYTAPRAKREVLSFIQLTPPAKETETLLYKVTEKYTRHLKNSSRGGAEQKDHDERVFVHIPLLILRQSKLHVFHIVEHFVKINLRIYVLTSFSQNVCCMIIFVYVTNVYLLSILINIVDHSIYNHFKNRIFPSKVFGFQKLHVKKMVLVFY